MICFQGVRGARPPCNERVPAEDAAAVRDAEGTPRGHGGGAALWIEDHDHSGQEEDAREGKEGVAWLPQGVWLTFSTDLFVWIFFYHRTKYSGSGAFSGAALN